MLLPWMAGILGTVIATIGGAYGVHTLRLSDNGSATAGPAPRPSASKSGSGSATPQAVDTLRLANLTFLDDSDYDTWAAPQVIDISAERSRAWRRTQLEDWPSYAKQMRAIGAVKVGTLDFEITFTGLHPDGLRILDIRPLAKCGPPLAGTLLYSPSAGSSEVVGLGFDFDSARPTARTLSRYGELGREYFKGKKYDLKKGERVTFRILATTDRKYCEFRLGVDLLVGDASVSKTVDDSGRPFRVTGTLTKKVDGVEDIAMDRYKAVYVGGVASPSGQKLAWLRQKP